MAKNNHQVSCRTLKGKRSFVMDRLVPSRMESQGLIGCYLIPNVMSWSGSNWHMEHHHNHDIPCVCLMKYGTKMVNAIRWATTSVTISRWRVMKLEAVASQLTITLIRYNRSILISHAVHFTSKSITTELRDLQAKGLCKDFQSILGLGIYLKRTLLFLFLSCSRGTHPIGFELLLTASLPSVYLAILC